MTTPERTARLLTGAACIALQLLPKADLLDNVDMSRLVDPDTVRAVEAADAAIVDNREKEGNTRNNARLRL